MSNAVRDTIRIIILVISLVLFFEITYIFWIVVNAQLAIAEFGDALQAGFNK